MAVLTLQTLLTLDLLLPGGLIEPVDRWLGPGPRSLEAASSAAFTVLVLTQLFNCFNARSATASAFRAIFSNRWLSVAMALSTALQAAVVHLAFPQPRLRHSAALGWSAVCMCGKGQRRALVRRGAQTVTAALDPALA